MRRFDKFMPVKVAFWLKDSDSPRWYLYIAPDQLASNNTDAAYGEILRLAEEIDDLYLDPFEVNLVRIDNPPARAAIEYNREYPSKNGAWLSGGSFGGIGVDGMHIYPALIGSVAP